MSNQTTYSNFTKQQLELSYGLKQIIDLLPTLKNKQVVTFCHDDPDGVTSGIIFKRLTDKLGIKNYLFFPYNFPLSKNEVFDVKEKFSPEALFIIDKGTLAEYNEFNKIIKTIVVIDHHPRIGDNFDNVILYNPAIPKYVRTSASLLVHILSTLFGNTNYYDDFICLIGMKCDWAVDPLNNDIPDFCLPFYEERIKPKYQWLTEKRNDLKLTMFDIKQQNYTCLLNQVAELFFAITGGGFQYFYNLYNDKLKDVDQPRLCFDSFVNEIKIENWHSVDQFIKSLPNKEVIELIYKYFLDDWSLVEDMFDKQTFLVKEINGVKIFFFFGKEVKLMPMVGSKKLYQFANNTEACIIMFNIEKNNNIHISFRGNTDKIHLGKIASTTADNIAAVIADKTKVSGGGHPFAAECKIKDEDIDLLSVLKIIINLLEKV